MRARKSWRGNATEDRRLIGMGAGTTGKYNNRNRECPAEDRRPEGRGTYRHGGTQAPPLVAARAAVEPLAPPWMLAMSLASVAGGGSRAAGRWGGGLPAMTPEARGDATIHGQGGNCRRTPISNPLEVAMRTSSVKVLLYRALGQ